MALRAVIFDMGETLLHYHPPDADPKQGWKAMESLGADAMRRYLQERGYSVPPEDEARSRNFAVMEYYWRQIGQEKTVNPQLRAMLRDVLVSWGLPDEALQDGLLDDVMTVYVAPVQAYVRPVEGAAETLAALQQQGYRLGLFSNTVWPGAFHQEDLARWGLADYLACAFFSADVGVWKPAPRAFLTVLETLDTAPEDALYIGDHPYFDVYGAQRAGLRGVWKRSDEWDPRQMQGLEITPDATVERLPELLEVVASWR
ncbi:MAG: HAD family hydrolase [Anaerolineae bacterium]